MVKFTNYFYRHEPPLIYPPHDVAALKVKLMLRRPITQLVAQGIMPRKFKYFLFGELGLIRDCAQLSRLPQHSMSNVKSWSVLKQVIC